jgi:hypothetical protein
VRLLGELAQVPRRAVESAVMRRDDRERLIPGDGVLVRATIAVAAAQPRSIAYFLGSNDAK